MGYNLIAVSDSELSGTRINDPGGSLFSFQYPNNPKAHSAVEPDGDRGDSSERRNESGKQHLKLPGSRRPPKPTRFKLWSSAHTLNRWT